MKISNETKVGLLTVVALTILILGFNFLKGNNVFDRSKKIYASYQTIGSLEKSNQVKVNGLPIGTVYDLREKDANMSGIVATINLTRKINIPNNSTATIVTQLVGSSYINIQLGDSKVFLKDGDSIRTKTDNGLFNDLTSQVNPTLTKARTAIDSLTAVLGSINSLFDTRTKNNIRTIVDNLTASSISLEKMMNSENSPLARSLDNFESITANLRKNNDSITSILHNANVAARKFAAIDIKPTLDSLHAAVLQIKDVVYKINHNNGSLGLLMNDTKLYDNLQKAALGLEILIDDVRVHPKRYVNISVFGKKDKGNYLTSPASKDSVAHK
jgi:phospholipid/cholesterol/gamma-HCH transport system substrate-binding protein